MQTYILAAEQVQSDLRSACAAQHGIPYEEVLSLCLGAQKVLDNVEIVFRNAAKYKLFSHRVLNVEKSQLEQDGLIPAYITTEDPDSYNDSLASIGCSKRVIYFLFIMRLNDFQIKERSHYAERLSKLEELCPKKNIEIFNTKKELVNCMDQKHPTYAMVQPLMEKYLQAVRSLIEVQKNIYQCELELNRRFFHYLTHAMREGFFEQKNDQRTSNVKALLQVFEGYKKRHLEIPPIKNKLSSQILTAVEEELKMHLENLGAEVKVLDEVKLFLDDVLDYMEKPQSEESHQETAEEEQDASFMQQLQNELSITFAQWLNKK